MLRIFKQNYPVRNIFFVLGEFLVIYLSGVLSTLILYGTQFLITEHWLSLKILLIAFVCQTCLYYNDLYDLKVTDSFTELTIRLLQALGVTAILLAGIYLFFPKANVGLKVFVISIGFDLLFIVSWRFCYASILNRRLFDRKVAVLGSDAFARDIVREINERKDCGYIVSGVAFEGREEDDLKMQNLIYFFRCECNRDTVVIEHKDQDKLCEIMKKLEISTIVVTLREWDPQFPSKELLKCRVNGIEVLEGNTFHEMLTGKLIVDHIRAEWLIFSDGFKKSWEHLFLKRSVDLILSLIMLIFLFPLIFLTAIIIKLDKKEPESDPADIWRYFTKLCHKENVSVADKVYELVKFSVSASSDERVAQVWTRFKEKCARDQKESHVQLLNLIKNYIQNNEADKGPERPIFFAQERMGMDGKIYNIYKFRSMIVNAERFSGPVWAGENDKRITRVGNFLRKSRIDEIPQLWNVLKGEMSFVGPRPERAHFVKQLEKTIPYYRERLTVKPGITGWAQVSYGYGATEDDAKEKLNYDLFYIKNMSILMDLMIVLRTVKIVIFGKGR